MYLEVQQSWNVIIGPDKLMQEGLMLTKTILTKLMDDFSTKAASKDLGYFIAVKSIDSIGQGLVRQDTCEVLFPVLFTSIIFKLHTGEVIQGVVQKILRDGMFLMCGPVDTLFLSRLKMPDYKYVPGENPIFLNENAVTIKKDVVVRVMVIGSKYIEAEKKIQALVGLDGDYLGHVDETA